MVKSRFSPFPPSNSEDFPFADWIRFFRCRPVFPALIRKFAPVSPDSERDGRILPANSESVPEPPGRNVWTSASHGQFTLSHGQFTPSHGQFEPSQSQFVRNSGRSERVRGADTQRLPAGRDRVQEVGASQSTAAVQTGCSPPGSSPVSYGVRGRSAPGSTPSPRTARSAPIFSLPSARHRVGSLVEATVAGVQALLAAFHRRTVNP